MQKLAGYPWTGLASLPPDQQFKRLPARELACATRFYDVTPVHLLATAVRQWSGDIQGWLNDSDATWNLRLTTCMSHPIGETVTRQSWESGSASWVSTPLGTVELKKDEGTGYRVVRLGVSRGF